MLVKINYEGIGELLKSEWAADCCTEVAGNIAANAGDGYEVAEPHDTGQRVAVNVYAATEEAQRDNYENNTLLRTLG
jgi:hypothetical protein